MRKNVKNVVNIIYMQSCICFVEYEKHSIDLTEES